jgi:hypothetical protein
MSNSVATRVAYRKWKLGLLLALVPVLSNLQGCTTDKFAYLDGERWNRVELDTFDTRIVSIDGRSYPYNSSIRVDPGPHHIVFETKPVAGFTLGPQRALDLDVQPCTRYYFEGKRNNALQQDFVPRVNYTESIPGCGVGSSTAMGNTRKSY